MTWSSPVPGFTKSEGATTRPVAQHTHDSVNTTELRTLGKAGVTIGSEISILDWSYSGAFTSSDADTVAWASGTLRLSNGSEYSIDAGNTGNMAAKTFVYFDLNLSLTTFQTSTTRNDAIGFGKILIAVAENSSSSAVFNKFNDNELNISVSTIAAVSGTIGGFSIGSDYIRDAANSFGMASTVTGGDDVRFWAGDTYANRATAPYRVTEAGTVTATSISISTSNSNIEGTALINSSTAENVQNRAEDDYSQYDFVYKGTMFDSDTALTSPVWTLFLGGGSITREPLTTVVKTVGTSGNTTKMTSVAPLGRHIVGGSQTRFDWDKIDISFSFTMEADDTTNQDLFYGLLVEGGVLGDNATETERHIGFYFEDATVYASNADGTTQTKTDVTAGFTFDTFQFMEILWNSGTNIVFKIDGTIIATHTTNLPSGNTYPTMIFYNRTQENQPKSVTIKNNYVLAANLV